MAQVSATGSTGVSGLIRANQAGFVTLLLLSVVVLGISVAIGFGFLRHVDQLGLPLHFHI